MSQSIAVLGAGSWGTSLAIHLARSGATVHLWGRNAEAILDMQRCQENKQYLPGCPFPASLQPTHDLDQACQSADMVCIVVPTSAFSPIEVYPTFLILPL